MKGIDVKKVLFWIFLILGIILLVWNAIGESPGEYAGIMVITLTVLLKIWSVSEGQVRLEGKFKVQIEKFNNLMEKFDILAKEFNLLRGRKK